MSSMLDAAFVEEAAQMAAEVGCSIFGTHFWVCVSEFGYYRVGVVNCVGCLYFWSCGLGS